ncbi:hypothetical protein [Microlunatus ginsengisoli]|uniref:Uncharacterized protein n=1 Tax=Microlunatus ginsengisoli TaxID=363863 RepID=A0ABP7A2H6_9ACTN
MTDTHGEEHNDVSDNDQQQESSSSGEPGWEALEILRARVREAEARRDASIADLRQEMGDQDVLDEFGIDLSRLED